MKLAKRSRRHIPPAGALPGSTQRSALSNSGRDMCGAAYVGMRLLRV
jgi:hypothetical protein